MAQCRRGRSRHFGGHVGDGIGVTRTDEPRNSAVGGDVDASLWGTPPRKGDAVSVFAQDRQGEPDNATEIVAMRRICFGLSAVTVCGSVAASSAARSPGARPGRQGLPQLSRAALPTVSPRLESRRSCGRLIGQDRRDHGVDSREFIVGRTSGDDADGRRGGRFDRLAHSGIFPCFLGGRLARFPLRARRALMIATRVAAGSMIPSSSPRSAARNGLATL